MATNKNKKKGKKRDQKKIKTPPPPAAAAFEALPLNEDRRGRGRAPVVATGSSFDVTEEECFHGTSKENVNADSEFTKCLNRYLVFVFASAATHRSDWFVESKKNFYNENRRFVCDPDFCRFIFALAASHYFNQGVSGDEKRVNVKRVLAFGIEIRYAFIPYLEKKDTSPGSKLYDRCVKYGRDINTERGIIKCLARETPCKCMDAAHKEAASMVKVGRCNGCAQEFPKKEMFYCPCRISAYCSKECQKKDWNDHKPRCTTLL